MNPILLFVALLVAAYLGGLVSAKRTLNLSSGGEFLVIGALVGPSMLGLVDRGTLLSFQPLLLMALGWMAAVHGLGHGAVGARRARTRSYFLSFLLAALGALFTYGAAYLLARWCGAFRQSDHLLAALAMAAVLSGTRELHFPASSHLGELNRYRAELGNSHNLVALGALAALPSLVPPETVLRLPAWSWPLLGVATGIVLGVTVASLIGSTLHLAELWPILLGAVLMTVGLSLRFELPLLPPAFVLGLTVVALSPEASKVRALAQKTERPLVLPVTLLAGSFISWQMEVGTWLFVGSMLLTRVLVQYSIGRLFALGTDASRDRAHEFALSFLPVGGGSLALGLTILFWNEEEVGRCAFLLSALALLFGDLTGTRALGRVALPSQPDESEAKGPHLREPGPAELSRGQPHSEEALPAPKEAT